MSQRIYHYLLLGGFNCVVDQKDAGFSFSSQNWRFAVLFEMAGTVLWPACFEPNVSHPLGSAWLFWLSEDTGQNQAWGQGRLGKRSYKGQSLGFEDFYSILKFEIPLQQWGKSKVPTLGVALQPEQSTWSQPRAGSPLVIPNMSSAWGEGGCCCLLCSAGFMCTLSWVMAGSEK